MQCRSHSSDSESVSLSGVWCEGGGCRYLIGVLGEQGVLGGIRAVHQTDEDTPVSASASVPHSALPPSSPLGPHPPLSLCVLRSAFASPASCDVLGWWLRRRPR